MLVNLILVLLSGVSLYAQSESSRQQRITAKYQNKTILEVLEDLKTKTKISIEHIMPQTLSDQWKKDLGPEWERIH